MSLWGNLLTGAAQGAFASAVDGLGGREVPAPRGPGGRIFEMLCAQLGWDIDARHGADGFELHFADRQFGTRQVLVTWGDRVGVFSLRSAAEFRPAELVPEVGLYLLSRNKDAVFASWQMGDVGDGRLGFTAAFSTFTAGVDAPAVKAICEKLYEEVTAVDRGLRAKGLI